jgi:hypothetical protein
MQEQFWRTILNSSRHPLHLDSPFPCPHLRQIVRRLHPHQRVGAQADAFSKRIAISADSPARPPSRLLIAPTSHAAALPCQ